MTLNEKSAQCNQFHNQLIDWSKEITDYSVRVDFINECVLICLSVHRFDKDMVKKMSKNKLLFWLKLL
jgi:hypothetical protein